MPDKNPKEDKGLVAEALDHGAELVELPEPRVVSEDGRDLGPATVPGIKDRLGQRKVNFYPGLTRYDWPSLVNHTFDLQAGAKIEDWESSEYGTSTFVLMKIRFPNGSEGTTKSGAKAIVKQVSQLIKMRGFPVNVTLQYAPGETGGNPYYLFI